MHLIGLKQEEGWVYSGWKLTWPVGWSTILKGVAYMYDFYDDPEILIRFEHVDVKSKEDILNLEEELNMTIRGYSQVLKTRIAITFYNQVSNVEVDIPQELDEYKDTDYEKLNHSLCQYLDSVEINMFT